MPKKQEKAQKVTTALAEATIPIYYNDVVFNFPVGTPFSQAIAVVSDKVGLTSFRVLENAIPMTKQDAPDFLEVGKSYRVTPHDVAA
jgi:hypothetical protein